MRIIETSAPIKIEDLKKYFEDKNTFFLIDYEKSTIKAEKLLTYISNLDVPCDIRFNSREDLKEMIGCYLKSSFIVSIPSLENTVISILLQHKSIIGIADQDFLDEFKDHLDSWTTKLESLALYNLYIINEESFKKWVVEEHDEDSTSSLEGVNFVSLLKNVDFYDFYQNMVKVPKYYSCYFNEYMFKGQNLYSYWANGNNPMFLLTWGIAEGKFNPQDYAEIAKKNF